MAKNKHGAEFLGGSVEVVETQVVAASATTTVAGQTEQTVTVTMPLGEVGNGYITKHVEVRLNAEQAEAMRRLQRGLRVTNQELRNGRPIATAADVVRWVLEQVA